MSRAIRFKQRYSNGEIPVVRAGTHGLCVLKSGWLDQSYQNNLNYLSNQICPITQIIQITQIPVRTIQLVNFRK